MGMVDVSEKEASRREALAQGRVRLKPEIITLIRKSKIPKGDVLEMARFAGILAAKKTPEIIPLCHPLLVDFIDIEFLLKEGEIIILSRVRGIAKTGFEMEALSATCVAALTIYDMCKPLDKGIVISEIKLIKKSGGKSGVWQR